MFCFIALLRALFSLSLSLTPMSCRALRQRARSIALATSHPTWLVSRWLKRFGEAGAIALCRHNNRSAPAYGLRVNRGRTDAAALLGRLSAAGAAAEHSELMPDDFLRCREGCICSRRR